MGDSFARQRARIALHDALQHLGLALRPIVHHLGLGSPRSGSLHLVQLDLGHPLGTLGPATDQRLDFLVNGVDICPDLIEIPVVCHAVTLAVALLEVLHEGDQRIHRLFTHRIVDAGAHTAHRAMPLEVEQARRFRLLQEQLVQAASARVKGTFISERLASSTGLA